MAAAVLPVQEKTVVCASCDAGCLLTAKVRDGRVVKVQASLVG